MKLKLNFRSPNLVDISSCFNLHLGVVSTLCVASYPGSQDRGKESLVLTACACVSLIQNIFGYDVYVYSKARHNVITRAAHAYVRCTEDVCSLHSYGNFFSFSVPLVHV